MSLIWLISLSHVFHFTNNAPDIFLLMKYYFLLLFEVFCYGFVRIADAEADAASEADENAEYQNNYYYQHEGAFVF